MPDSYRPTDSDGGRTVRITLLSVVVPCLNEAPVIEETNRRLIETLEGIEGVSFEIVYVDDGSSDATPEILRRICDADPRVHALRLSRNFGHQLAITAGLENSAGDAAVIIDSDLQDPPELIPEMLEKWQSGYDVVYGTRTDRVGESRFKTGTAKMFYRILNRVSDVKIPLDTGDFRLIDRKVINAFLNMRESHRFVRGMVAWVGFNQTTLPYSRQPRAAGKTKYPFRKMLRFALDGIASFSLAPLRLVTIIGFFASFLALLGIITALISRLFTQNWVPGWAGIFIALLFIGGVQMISMGILGEYIGRIYAEVKRRPLYLVREWMGYQPYSGGDSSAETHAPAEARLTDPGNLI